MKKNVFWRLFNTAVLTTVVWCSIGLVVYGYTNDSNTGGTLLDIFRGRSASPNPTPTYNAPPLSSVPMAMPAPQMGNSPETLDMGNSPSGNFSPVPYSPVPAAPAPQPVVQNKWSLKNLLNGVPPSQPQYVESMPTPAPAYNHPHSHGPHPAMPAGPKTQYPVVPLDSQDFVPLEGAIYNEKGEMIYSPESGGVLPEGAGGGMVIDANGNKVTVDNNGAALPYNESNPGVKRIIMGGRGSAAPVNQERIYSQQGVSPNGVIYPSPEPIPAQMPNNPYVQPPSGSAGDYPAGSGHSIIDEKPGTLNLNSGATSFSKTYQPINRLTSVPPQPAMDIKEPALADALPQDSEAASLRNGEQGTGNGQPALVNSNSPAANPIPQSAPLVQNSKPFPTSQAIPRPAIGAQTTTASPVIEDIHNASPLENLSEKSAQAPALEPVPESVPEIDVPKETVGSRQEAVGSRQEVVGSSENTQATNGSESWQTRGCEAARADGRGYASEKADFGATHVNLGTDPVGADGERRLAANSQLATDTPPLIVEIDGPEEVEFGKNETFSLSVINTTDTVRRDIVLSVHPEGFGDDKTASLNLEQLAPGEKKSVYMKLNARQYNNLSLTAQVRDALGFETTKAINLSVKNESVKISILPPQAGNAYVGQPTQYIVRFVNNDDKDVSFNAMAFFGNGIEPIRASGAPNTIQSGQVVVNKPIELKQGEMRDLKIIAVAFQPGIHKILVQLIDSRGSTYAAKESCAYRQREFEDNASETTEERDARIELTPGKSEIGVWKPAKAIPEPAVGNREQVNEKSEVRQPETQPMEEATPDLPPAVPTDPSPAPPLNAPNVIPLTQPDQGPQGDLIMPMFAQ